MLLNGSLNTGGAQCTEITRVDKATSIRLSNKVDDIDFFNTLVSLRKDNICKVQSRTSSSKLISLFNSFCN